MPGPVLLNNVDHADLRVMVGHGAKFGDDVNQSPIVAAEFEEAQREYAIVFRNDGDGMQAYVLLGLDARENLFLAGSEWRARYVPAIRRRGPLSAGLQATGASGQAEVVIHIDPENPRVSRIDGAPLFLEHGGSAPVLELMSDALRVVHGGLALTRALTQALAENNLLRPATLEVEVGGGRHYQIADVFIVDRDALGDLGGEALRSLNREGFLALAMFAASSLANLGRLAALKRDRDGQP